MHKQGVGDFPFYCGINSLSELATKDDRVVVLNILGKESSGVTPISNDYSGGNIVFGTGPGKSGKSLVTRFTRADPSVCCGWSGRTQCHSRDELSTRDS